MSILSQLGFHPTFKEPERYDPSISRLRRVNAELDRQRKVLEDQSRRGLSPANNYYTKLLEDFEIRNRNEIEARARRLKEFDANSRAHIASRSRLFQLIQRREALQIKASNEKRRRGQALAGDRRFFNFRSDSKGRTVFGTLAFLNEVAHKPRFTRPGIVVPCIQRQERKEVMFAKRHAGKGHRVRHRFNPLSFVEC